MHGEAIPRVIGMSLCAAALLAAVPARAQQDQNRAWCENRDGARPWSSRSPAAPR